ncbi:hypothetical protein [Parafilimonas sp.]|uniref:hypothetical protein n=1 Tax=Parafilimonas sp. TaxID=1969739 RepID=UPI003F7E02E0
MKAIQSIVYFFFSLALFAQQKQTSNTFPIEKSICQIYLEDETTTTKALGANIWSKHFEADSMFPRIECINKSGTEGLRLFFHYGGTQNAVAEFELFYIPIGYKRPTKAVVLSTCQFKSGHNIMLGLSKEQVVTILGKSFEVVAKEDNREEIKYYTDNPNAEVLKKYGGVAYFIKCIFEKNKLVQYNFGFEYP